MKRLVVLTVAIVILLTPSGLLADDECCDGEKCLDVDIAVSENADVDVVVGSNSCLDFEVGDDSCVGMNVDGEGNQVTINGRNLNDPVAVHVHNSYSDDSAAYRRLKHKVAYMESVFGTFSETLNLTVDATAKTIVDLASVKEGLNQTGAEIEALERGFDSSLSGLGQQVEANSGRIASLSESTLAEVEILDNRIHELEDSLHTFKLMVGVLAAALLLAVTALFMRFGEHMGS